jgi:ribosomal protein S18 acetylase RimI-like enzyme
MKIEKADISHLTEIKEFLKKSWHNAYKEILPQKVIARAVNVWQTPEKLTAQFVNPAIHFAIVRDEENLPAAVMTLRKVSDNEVKILRLYVDADHRKRGLGSMLLKHISEVFPCQKTIRLDVDEKNATARNFYESRGFKIIGERQVRILGFTRKLIKMEKDLV